MTLVPTAEVLAGAREDQLASVAIVGRTEGGEIRVYGSHPDADAVIGLLQRGVLWLAEREQIDAPELADA